MSSRSKKTKETGADAASAAEERSVVGDNNAEPLLENALVLVEKLQDFGINARTKIILLLVRFKRSSRQEAI